MIISIHQPNYFPWPGYFFKILKSDIFVFLDDVQYSNNSFTCRTNILENKNKSWLSVPIKKKMGQKINQILIADLEWKMKHLSKIKNCYLKTEHFSFLWDKINLIYNYYLLLDSSLRFVKMALYELFRSSSLILLTR